jgi:hypothetical protein
MFFNLKKKEIKEERLVCNNDSSNNQLFLLNPNNIED